MHGSSRQLTVPISHLLRSRDQIHKTPGVLQSLVFAVILPSVKQTTVWTQVGMLVRRPA